MAEYCEPLDLSIKDSLNSLILPVDGDYPSAFRSAFVELSGLTGDLAIAEPLDLRVDTSTACSSMSIEENLTISEVNNAIELGELIVLVNMIVKLRKQH